MGKSCLREKFNPVLLSGFVHGLFLLSFFWISSIHRNKVPKNQEKVFTPQVLIELNQKQPTPVSSFKQKPSSGFHVQSQTKTQRPGTHSTKLLSQLGLAIPGVVQNTKRTDPAASLESQSVDQPEDNWVSSQGFLAGGAEKAASDPRHSLYDYIYQKIENNLTYPSELRDAGFQGTVSAFLIFDAQGNYLREGSKFKSSSPYLRVHTIRTLRKALVDPIPNTMYQDRQSLILKCSFRFLFSQNGDQDLVEEQKFVVGSHLFFYRSFYRSVLEWQLGPLKGLGPFSVGLDPSWLLEKGGGLFSHRAKIDPLEKYRDDPDW